MISSCCTFRLKRRRAFSRDSPSCSRTSAKLTHPQTRPDGPNSYYKDLTLSQVEAVEFLNSRQKRDSDHFETSGGWTGAAALRARKNRKMALGQSCRKSRLSENRSCQ